jgi:hypothetical protein
MLKRNRNRLGRVITRNEFRKRLTRRNPRKRLREMLLADKVLGKIHHRHLDKLMN